ncbi:hypothetical protein [Burkholderia pyrrocinia]|uniref:hypothetical protein n=1 Tax=Burkholderia pyrrocinia TaxID=60550 RepID=UPI00158A092F|nr:hypothetical protein [Burkholderia pyrrocinia]
MAASKLIREQAALRIEIGTVRPIECRDGAGVTRRARREHGAALSRFGQLEILDCRDLHANDRWYGGAAERLA